MVKGLIAGFTAAGRILKNILLRPLTAAYEKMRDRISERGSDGGADGVAEKIAALVKIKPKRREDYFDLGSVYAAKSLVFFLAVIAAVLPLLYIFLLHPLLTSLFWIRDFRAGDGELSDYSGRVRVYYGGEAEALCFEGRLQNGKAEGDGREYYESGRNRFVGAFSEGLYEGEGILYYEDGSAEYAGAFENGAPNGYGTLTLNGKLYYSGNFTDGGMNGEGKIFYPDGTARLVGSFTDGMLSGAALEYYADGTIKYNGTFTAGQYNGTGTLYAEDGRKRYSGDFEMGVYSGGGTLYGADGAKLYTGGFEEGRYGGYGTLYRSDGSVISGNFSGGEIVGAASCTFVSGRRYEGCFSDGLMNGGGTLSDVNGSFTYTGMFLDGDFDFRGLIGAEPKAVQEMMTGLSQTAGEDCFYLQSGAFGISLKCFYTSGGGTAAVAEVFERPISGAETIIDGVGDIAAPRASSVARAEDESLPQWASSQFGVSADGVDCYAAFYDQLAVYFWTEKETGRLLLKSARDISASSFPAVWEEAAEEDIQDLPQEEPSGLSESLDLIRRILKALDESGDGENEAEVIFYKNGEETGRYRIDLFSPPAVLSDRRRK